MALQALSYKDAAERNKARFRICAEALQHLVHNLLDSTKTYTVQSS